MQGSADPPEPIQKLIKRYGSRHQATEAFVSRALSLAGIEMMRPSLEGCQAFFLLGASDFGHGFGQRSWVRFLLGAEVTRRKKLISLALTQMLMGVAVRMAGILRLHREETFKLPPNATSEEIIAAEVARRTFWALYFHHDLTSTLNRPASFPLAEITCFLPCSEEDLIFGQLPTSRAALEGTEAARLDSEATNLPSRSLYASLVQSHCLWGKVARLACRAEGQLCPRPWEEGSEFATMHGELVQWEKAAPARHKFSVTTLRGMKAMRLDLVSRRCRNCSTSDHLLTLPFLGFPRHDYHHPALLPCTRSHVSTVRVLARSRLPLPAR